MHAAQVNNVFLKIGERITETQFGNKFQFWPAITINYNSGYQAVTFPAHYIW